MSKTNNKPHAMIMLNAGDRSVTVHATREQAFKDIFDVVISDVGWLVASNDPESSAELLQAMADDGETYEDLYGNYIEPWLAGEYNGSYMSVELVNLSGFDVLATIEGGVFDIYQLPYGVTVKVKDFDVEYYDLDELEEDIDGNTYKPIEYGHTE